MSDLAYTPFELTEAEWAMGLRGWRDVLDSGQLAVETPSDQRFARFVDENLPFAQELAAGAAEVSACEGSEGSE